MSATPKYDAMCSAVHDLHLNLERDGERIADPEAQLRYYETIAGGMQDAERTIVKIRRRAERTARKLLRECA